MKFERISLFEYATLPALHVTLEEWFDRYNHWHPHEKLGNLTPAAIYQVSPATLKIA